MSTYEISKSSLLSLKAEILKKQEELQKAKVENKQKLERDKKKPLDLKNKGVESRAANDGDVVDEDLLKKSRSQLEAKSKLYEKLSKGSSNDLEKEYNRRFLVHFDKKAHISSLNQSPVEEQEDADKYPQSEEEFNDHDYSGDENEWVEFIDSFGRTRTCLKQDLAAFKQKDKELKSTQRSEKSGSESPSKETQREHQEDEETTNESKQFDEQSELLSGDMRRELLRQQWEQEENLLKDKPDMHYQDILFNEARSHGVGYYGFSKDEETRKAQQEALKNLRKDTEAQQKLAQEVKQNREKQLAARIRAAKNRKRAREGLPPLTSDDEEEEKRATAELVAKQQVDDENEAEQTAKSASDDYDKEIIRQMHVRPWDIGKEGVIDPVESARIRSGVRDPYDQDEWNAIQREKRDREFAPPENYDSSKYIARTTSKTSSKKRDSHSVNPYKRKDCDSKFVQTPIQNECSSSSSEDDQDELLKDYARSRSGTNIPPPATYDYYGPSGSSKRPKMAKSDGNMEDAIMQGLRFLRDKIERKNN